MSTDPLDARARRPTRHRHGRSGRRAAVPRRGGRDGGAAARGIGHSSEGARGIRGTRARGQHGEGRRRTAPRRRRPLRARGDARTTSRSRSTTFGTTIASVPHASSTAARALVGAQFSLRTLERHPRPALAAFSVLPPNGLTPMRILFFVPMYLPWMGGLEVVTSQILDELQERGHEVTVLTSHAARDHPEYGDHQRDLRPADRRAPGDPAARRGGHSPRAARHPRVHRRVRARRDPRARRAASLWMYLRFLRGRPHPPIVLTLHNVMGQQYADNERGLPGLITLMQAADWLTGVSEDVVADAIASGPDCRRAHHDDPQRRRGAHAAGLAASPTGRRSSSPSVASCARRASTARSTRSPTSRRSTPICASRSSASARCSPTSGSRPPSSGVTGQHRIRGHGSITTTSPRSWTGGRAGDAVTVRRPARSSRWRQPGGRGRWSARWHPAWRGRWSTARTACSSTPRDPHALPDAMESLDPRPRPRPRARRRGPTSSRAGVVARRVRRRLRSRSTPSRYAVTRRAAGKVALQNPWQERDHGDVAEPIRVSPWVTHERLDDEVIAINLETGRVLRARRGGRRLLGVERSRRRDRRARRRRSPRATRSTSHRPAPTSRPSSSSWWRRASSSPARASSRRPVPLSPLAAKKPYARARRSRSTTTSKTCCCSTRSTRSTKPGGRSPRAD